MNVHVQRADGTPWLEVQLREGHGTRVLHVRHDGEGGFELRDEANGLVGVARRARPSTGPLTSREVDVLRLLAQGRTNQEIAGELGISVRTAESHRARIGRKLERSSRAGLVDWALDHGLVGF